jgi:hypothetical protein
MSRKYSRVERYLWRDPEFRSLSRLEKLLWLHLLTSSLSTSIPGLLPTSLVMLADEMGETLSKEFREAFERLVSLGWVKADDGARLIYLPGAVKHNMPESSNVIVGWASHFDEIPGSTLKSEWLQGVRLLFETNTDKDKTRLATLLKAFKESFETLSKPFRTPDHDPEHEQDQEQDSELKLELDQPGAEKPTSSDGFDLFWSAYPRKIAKSAARKAWAKTKNDRPEFEDVIRAIEVQKRSDAWKRDGGQYIPHPATWLNAGRWDDVVEQSNGRIAETPSDRAWREQREQAARWLREAQEKEARDAERENDSADHHHLLGGVCEVQDDGEPPKHLEDDDGRHTG